MFGSENSEHPNPQIRGADKGLTSAKSTEVRLCRSRRIRGSHSACEERIRGL